MGKLGEGQAQPRSSAEGRASPGSVTPHLKADPAPSGKNTKHFLNSSLSFKAASLASLRLRSPLAISALIEALLSHFYHRGNVALQIIIVL